MNAKIKILENTLPPAMKWALGISVLFHLSIVVIGTFGLPYIQKPVTIPQAIAIEIINISEETTTNRKPNKAVKPIEEKPAPKVEPKIQPPPKVEAKSPPKVDPIEPPKPKVETVKPKPKVPPPPSEKLEKVEEPKEKPKEPDDTEVAAAQEDAFLSVLKNLQDTEPAAEETTEDTSEKPVPQEASPLAKFSQQLSATEVDAIRSALNRQFGECWNLMAGARYAEDIIVQMRLVINPDRTVQSARIVDQWRYNQDSYYKAAADTALRAVSHPNCTTLDLPPEKYDLWKDMIFNFNPAAQL